MNSQLPDPLPDTAMNDVEGSVQRTSEGDAVESKDQEQEESHISASCDVEQTSSPEPCDDPQPLLNVEGTTNLNRWGDHYMMVW